TLNPDNCLAMAGSQVAPAACQAAERTVCCQYLSGDPLAVTHDYVTAEICSQQLSGTELSGACGEAEIRCCQYAAADGTTTYNYHSVRECVGELEGTALADDAACAAGQVDVCCRHSDGSYSRGAAEFCQWPSAMVADSYCDPDVEAAWSANATDHRGL